MSNKSGSFTVQGDTNSNHTFEVRLTEDDKLIQVRNVPTRGQALNLIEAYAAGKYNPGLLIESDISG